MFRLIAIGLLSGLFFSSTFILNRLMSLEGGHWVWSAALCCGYMIIFLMILLTFVSRCTVTTASAAAVSTALAVLVFARK